MAATRQCCVVVLLLALCCVWTEAVGDPVIDLSRRVLNTRSALLLFLVHARMTTNIHCYAAHTAADTSCAHMKSELYVTMLTEQLVVSTVHNVFHTSFPLRGTAYRQADVSSWLRHRWLR